MWFFGFSTSNPRNFWIIGAIILIIILTIILRKWAFHLDHPHDQEKSPPNKTSEITLVDVQIHKDISNSTTTSTSTIICCNSSNSVIRTYALEELKIATKDFRVRIGVGATSFVYLAELGDGRLGAVKRVMEERGGSKKMFMDEVSILLRISHPNLVGLLGFCLEKGN